MRRSVPALSIIAAVSATSQNAWIVIRGTGAIIRSDVSGWSAMTRPSGSGA